MIYRTDTSATRACRKWQRILRLQDWDIQVSIQRQEFVKTGGQAECEWTKTKKQAVIRLVDPVDYSRELGWPQDHEISLVHELLHLHFSPFDAVADSPEHLAQEQVIECISTALVRSKRR